MHMNCVTLGKLPIRLIYRNRQANLETEDLYIENYKTLVKEIKEDTNRWKNIHVHGLEESI